MKNRFEGGDLVVESLQNLGVKQLFSVSGGPLNSIYHSAANNGLPILHARHETAAGFMAEAVSRITGTPGVAVVTLGPAVTNSVTAAFMAQMAGTPLLIIGGQGNISDFDRGAEMQGKHVRIMTPVTKFAARVLDTARIPEYIEMAWRHMWAGRPGPVFLEIPINVLSAAAEPQAPAGPPAGRVAGLTPATAAEISAALGKARRPMLVIGDEARWEMNAGFDPARLRALVERHHMAFTSLRLARGLIDERHEQYCGPTCVFANKTMLKALGEADLVLLLGHHMESDLDFGAPVRDDATVIQCYPDVEFLGRNRRSDIATMAGVGAVVDHMLALEPLALDRDWVDSAAAAWRAERAAQAGDDAADTPLHPVAVVDAVCAAMPDDTVFVAGAGNVDFWTDGRIQVKAPNKYIKGGQGGAIGADVPYGVGARAADPDCPVVVLVGDGGLAYHAVELDTAERYDRPIIIVVMDDQKWGCIAIPQKLDYGAEFEMDLKERDWPGFARSLGGFGIRAETVPEIGDAMRAALESGKPALVHVPVRSVLSPFMEVVGF
jgi:acetolactate synthase-1/2/3 large subunit